MEVVYSGAIKFFWEGAPQARVFECKVPKSKFQEKFHWFYLYENGDYEPITPESMYYSSSRFSFNKKKSHIFKHKALFLLESTKQNKSTPEPERYIDRVKINFPSRNITHVVCAGYLLEDGTSYNNTLAVKIKGTMPLY